MDAKMDGNKMGGDKMGAPGIGGHKMDGDNKRQKNGPLDKKTRKTEITGRALVFA